MVYYTGPIYYGILYRANILWYIIQGQYIMVYYTGPIRCSRVVSFTILYRANKVQSCGKLYHIIQANKVQSCGKLYHIIQANKVQSCGKLYHIIQGQ